MGLNALTKFECTECGKACVPREFHDYIECIRHRWSIGYPRAGGAEGAEINLGQAERDLKSLLAFIDQRMPAPRSYEPKT